MRRLRSCNAVPGRHSERPGDAPSLLTVLPDVRPAPAVRPPTRRVAGVGLLPLSLVSHVTQASPVISLCLRLALWKGSVTMAPTWQDSCEDEGGWSLRLCPLGGTAPPAQAAPARLRRRLYVQEPRKVDRRPLGLSRSCRWRVPGKGTPAAAPGDVQSPPSTVA